MDSEVNSPPKDDSTFNPIGRTMIALVLGFSIVILLNLFNRGGHFALLSAIFGILLYGLLIALNWLLERRRGQKKTSRGPTDGPKTLREVIARIWRELLFFALEALVGFLGLLFLPDQQSLLFAAINGVLGFLFYKGLFDLGLVVTVILIGYKMDFQPLVVDGGNDDDKPIT